MLLSRCRSLSCSVVAIVRSHHLNPQSRKKQKRNTGIRGNRSLGAWIRCRKRSAVYLLIITCLSLFPRLRCISLSPTHISDFAFFTWLFISRSGIVLSSSFLPPSQWAFGRLACDISAPRVHHSSSSSSSSRATALLSPFFSIGEEAKRKTQKANCILLAEYFGRKKKKNHNNNSYINT